MLVVGGAVDAGTAVPVEVDKVAIITGNNNNMIRKEIDARKDFQ